MNLIPKIAELLGVEIGEEFKMKAVGDCDTSLAHFLYRFTETEFQFKNNGYWVKTHIPTSLFMGLVEVEKLPFEPKDGEIYYTVAWDREKIWCPDATWREYGEHYCRKYCGNVFRTRAEAEKHKYEIYEKLTGKNVFGKDITCQYCLGTGEIEEKKQTNFQRITASPEALAELMYDCADCDNCPITDKSVCQYKYENCKEAWEAWLKQEIKE